MERIILSTTQKIQIIDITDKIENIVENSGIKKGICQIFAPHATASIILQENEQGLKKDIIKTIKKLFYGKNYEHDIIDDNAASHLASGFLGQSKILPIENSKLIRGTWQRILFIELDGPRNYREVIVNLIKN